MKKIVYGNELYHYGVPGQKWGVRNYQNEDGSYKPGAEGRYYDPVSGGKGGGTSRAKKKVFSKAFIDPMKNKPTAHVEANPTLFKKKSRNAYLDDNKKMKISSTDDDRTKEVKNDYNNLSDSDFFKKHMVRKDEYLTRVIRSGGDPYAKNKIGRGISEFAKKNPLAKFTVKSILKSGTKRQIRGEEKAKEAQRDGKITFTRSALEIGSGIVGLPIGKGILDIAESFAKKGSHIYTRYNTKKRTKSDFKYINDNYDELVSR